MFIGVHFGFWYIKDFPTFFSLLFIDVNPLKNKLIHSMIMESYKMTQQLGNLF